ncbi:MAG TPA: hypothetical protein P5137_00135 [Candidatus Brocadiia bacterium]|nr:hypothetical protein [Candidatus Brocadiia bacterium]
MDTPVSGACAVAREDGPGYSIPRAAAAMAQVLSGVAPDWARELRDRPGILAEDLPPDTAEALVHALAGHRIPAFVVAQDEMAVPPPPFLASEAQLTEEGFLCRSGQQKALAPWDEVILFECARVRAASRGPLDLLRRNRAAAPRGTAGDQEATSHDLLDIVCYQPWLHVRVDSETFQFASLGLPPQPARRQSFANLVRVIRGRCPEATAGPGALLILGRGEGALTLPTIEACDNNLLWRLQLLWRAEE